MIIFFDLDDTLYDRATPFIQTYRKIYGDISDDKGHRLYEACNRRGDQVFLPSQRGDISMEQMYIYRYCNGFTDMGLTLTAKEALDFQKVYRQMQKEIVPAPGVISALVRAKDAFEAVGIITNGPSDNQREKINTLRLSEWIESDLIIISKEVGAPKPSPEIFTAAAEAAGKFRLKQSNSFVIDKGCNAKGEEPVADRVCNVEEKGPAIVDICQPHEFIMVGDSLDKDIEPAIKLGWHTVWLNINKETPRPDIRPERTISSMEEFLPQLITSTQN